jgi:hypothetical protein
VRDLLDAGIEGLILQLPNPYDLETVGLAGETLRRAMPARVA